MRTLRPAGCIAVLLLAAVMVYMCFTTGKDPIPGYSPPESSEYYAVHPDELKSELEANVFPHLKGLQDCRIVDGRLQISFEYDSFVASRSVLLRYYDESLFRLVQLEKP